MTFADNVIPLVDLQASHSEVAEEITNDFQRVMTEGAFIKGRDVTEFELEFASFSGVKHCVGVANGTDALELALRATGIPQGAEVVVPANTFARYGRGGRTGGGSSNILRRRSGSSTVGSYVRKPGDKREYRCDTAGAPVRSDGADEGAIRHSIEATYHCD